MTRTKALGALAAPALLLSLSGARPAVAAIDIGTCSKAIYAEGLKAETALEKAFQACDALYRKEKVAAAKVGAAPNYSDVTDAAGRKGSKAASGCQKKLNAKSGILALDVGKANLDTKVFGKKCDDTNLLLLGHPPVGKFGDLWSRAVMMAALNHAYQMQTAAVRDTSNMFQDLGCAPAEAGPACLPTHLTSCTLCDALTRSPCYEHSCSYLTPGASGFHLVSSTGLDISGNLIGSTGFTLCQFPAVNPVNEYIVLGGATSKGIQAVDIGIGHACPLQIAAEGYISCGGAHGVINYSTCQDSKVQTFADNKGGCQAAITPDVCFPTTCDTQDGGVNCTAPFNGGACTKFNPAGAGSGAAFIINTTQLDVPIAGQEGADGIPCTNDDTEARAIPSSIGLTTGTADTQVLHFGTDNPDTTVTAGPITGAPFPCGSIQSSNLSGAKIAGAFTGAGLPTTDDSTTTFFIGCQ